MSSIGANTSLPGEGPLKWVKKQIDARQRIYGKQENRTPEEINYLNNRKPWIKLASSVRVKEEGLKKLRQAGLGGYGKGRNLGKNFVLFNGVTKQNAEEGLSQGFRSGIGTGDDLAYGIGGKDFGYKPMPGIQSVSVSTKGNYGSLKEATVKIHAYNKQQFDIIELLYLRLGYSILLEFGNNVYIDSAQGTTIKTMGPTLADGPWFDNTLFDVPADTLASIQESERLASFYESVDNPFNKNREDAQNFYNKQASELRSLAAKKANNAVQQNVINAQKLVLDLKKKYTGNYEGMIGKVSNFNWELKPNGVYDITLKIITYGDLINGFFVNTKKVFPADGEVGGSLAGDIIGGTVSFFASLFGSEEEPDPPEIPDVDKKFLKNAKDVTDINGILYMFYDALYNGAENVHRSKIGGGNPWKFYTNNIDKNEVSLPTSDPADIFDIKVKGSADGEGGEGFTDDKYISLGYYLDILNKFTLGFIDDQIGSVGLSPKADSENGPILFDNQIDTHFCNTSYYHLSANPTVCLIKNIGGPAPILEDSKYRNFKKFKNGIRVGDIMNIYLQMNFLAELCYNAGKNEDAKITVKDHVEEILLQVSEALGGLVRLRIRCDENTGKLYIFDENPLPSRGLIVDYLNSGANTEKPVEFLVYGFSGEKGSFVRDFGIKSSIDNNLATTITLGKSSTGITPGYDATPFANWNQGLEDVVMPSLVVSTQEEATLSELKDQYEKKLENLAVLANKLYKNDEKVKLKYVQQTMNCLREVVQLEQSVHAAELSDKGSSPMVGFLPISLNLTVDGLSGLKIFQTYTVPAEFLPSQYPKAFDFIIKKYSHEVNNQGWTTKLESLSIPAEQENVLNEPWAKLLPAKLAEIIAEAQQEINDAEFAARQTLFDARTAAYGGAGGGAGSIGGGALSGGETSPSLSSLFGSSLTSLPAIEQKLRNKMTSLSFRWPTDKGLIWVRTDEVVDDKFHDVVALVEGGKVTYLAPASTIPGKPTFVNPSHPTRNVSATNPKRAPVYREDQQVIDGKIANAPIFGNPRVADDVLFFNDRIEHDYWRDTNKDLVVDRTLMVTGNTGLQFHRAGIGNIVDSWSIGCMVVPDSYWNNIYPKFTPGDLIDITLLYIPGAELG